VDLREPVHSRKPRTLWPQLLHDLLGKQWLFEKDSPLFHNFSGSLGSLL
jgi:hypothetical protein